MVLWVRAPYRAAEKSGGAWEFFFIYRSTLPPLRTLEGKTLSGFINNAVLNPVHSCGAMSFI
jgi:hypothetical protein